MRRPIPSGNRPVSFWHPLQSHAAQQARAADERVDGVVDQLAVRVPPERIGNMFTKNGKEAAKTCAKGLSCGPPRATTSYPQACCRRLCPLPAGERAARVYNIKERVRGFGSITWAGNPLTPTLSPNGERERTEFAGPLIPLQPNTHHPVWSN